MKKEMKKGRILIHHFQESNQRIFKKDTKDDFSIKKQRKGPYAPTDTMKMRMGGIHRPSYSHLDNPTKFVEKDYLALEDNYKGLDSFEVDNLAMKITTFKRR